MLNMKEAIHRQLTYHNKSSINPAEISKASGGG
jgi:hypothetical protein